MKRRESIKTIALGSAAFPFIVPSNKILNWIENSEIARGVTFESDWEIWPDISWVGPAYWGNRLQDWKIEDGKVICNAVGGNRTLYLLTVQNVDGISNFKGQLTFRMTLEDAKKQGNEYFVGLRIGSKGPYEEYQSAAVFGEGFDIGVVDSKFLRIGEKQIPLENELDAKTSYTLSLEVGSKNSGKVLSVTLKGADDVEIIKTEEAISDVNTLRGSFALVSSVGGDQHKAVPGLSAEFAKWRIDSDGLVANNNNLFGPICFAQYTTNLRKLRFTAQLAPIERVPGHKLELQFKEGQEWITSRTTKIDHPGRAKNFVFDDWDTSKEVPYRLRLTLPMKNGTVYEYFYDGSIAKEPEANEIKAAVFSCNFHTGFPDADVPEYMEKLKPDLCLFLGDQFYEGTGGYGVTYEGTLDELCLEYLRKWYMFGWSYRDIYRNIPCAILPDDHDVFHGNIWGESGKPADTSEGFRATAQDSGGYKMSAEWVNMVQYTQTSHLPTPFDATPIKQDIGVYYTHWNYGWLSFAILEDRKFKSAPNSVLPKEAKIYNGFVTNPDYDIKTSRGIKAELLGRRQEEFLETWVEDWSEGAAMKVVLSQTNFAAVQTVPKNWPLGKSITSLEPPREGQYQAGDTPTADMDSNGWPIDKRDEAVALIRKAFAFHIAGDQHLASYVQYGIEEYGDSGYAFAGPALSNLFVRRFWPELDFSTHSVDKPAYRGNFEDGFGNKFTAMGIANPHKTNREPAVLMDRSTGYGIVTFNKKDRTIRTDCYRRKIDPSDSYAQFPDWPITVTQMDNYGRKAEAWLPTLKIQSDELPVCKVYDQDGQLVYALRLKDRVFIPKVFAKGRYTIVLEIPEMNKRKTLGNVKAKTKKNSKRILEVKLT